MTNEDYLMISTWYKEYGQNPPVLESLPMDTSFIMEKDNNPVLSASIYLTNSKWYARVEHLIGNPSIDKSERQLTTQQGLKYLESLIKELGYKNMIVHTDEPKLVNYYNNLGFTNTATNVTTLIKRVL